MGLEKFGVIKKKGLLFMMVAGLGGLEQGRGGTESPTPPGTVDEQLSFSVLVCDGFRIILYCFPPQLMVIWEWGWGCGGTLPPSPPCVLRFWQGKSPACELSKGIQ